MSTPSAHQPSAPKKHRPAPRTELRAIVAAPPSLSAFTTPDRPSALSLPPNLQRARRRQTFGPRRVLFPES